MSSPAKDIPLNERIIFALDVPDGDAAHRWITRLEPQVGFFKIGLELFAAGGPGLVRELAARGHKLMLDVKFYDVPATVGRAVARLRDCGAVFVTIHGDGAIIRAAAAAESGIGLLAVTVLTSLDRRAMEELGITCPLEELVVRRARLAVDAGCAGVVASALEAQALRRELGDAPVIVCPGIRPQPGADDDQKRTATAAQAIAAGADHLVVGRPIRDSKEPLETAAQIRQQIANALESTTDEHG